jgi:hypothetical protein
MTEDDILTMAKKIHTKKALESRLSRFKEQKDTITVRWSNNYDRTRPNDPSYDGVEVPLELVQEFITEYFKKLISDNDISSTLEQYIRIDTANRPV